MRATVSIVIHMYIEKILSAMYMSRGVVLLTTNADRATTQSQENLMVADIHKINKAKE